VRLVSKYALIVANSRYSDPKLSGIVAPVNDAATLSGVLADAAIGNYHVSSQVDKPHYELQVAIDEFFSDRQPEDLLLLYVSGHGVKDEAGRLFFACANTSLKKLRATAVPASFINEAMRVCRSRRKILVLDTCFSAHLQKA